MEQEFSDSCPDPPPPPVPSSTSPLSSLSSTTPPPPREPRSLRFTFSVGTTSAKPPADILAEIVRVLTEDRIEHEVTGFVCVCYAEEDLEFEIEVCGIPRLNLNGLRFKRMSGNSWTYKNLLTDLIARMRL
ncbi:KA1 domain/Ssp2 C-terminal domain-containing protein [Zopfochytrium polystomum]|nr:KA1 domain/Ssp2 C-terminal domain-containing protein [Zopfochytrium polystomum]